MNHGVDPNTMCFDCIAAEVAELVEALRARGAELVIDDDGVLRLRCSRSVPADLVHRVEQLRGPLGALVEAEQATTPTEGEPRT
jgi:hypothetical protein